jgi:hypothetical protein
MAELLAIFGSGRNGSTLLGRVLDGGPDLWMHPVEVNYLAVWSDFARLGRTEYATLLNASTRPLDRLDATLPAPLLVEEFAHHWRDIRTSYLARLSTPLPDVADPADELLRRERWTASEFLPAFLDATRRAFGGAEHSGRILGFKTIETPYVDDYLRVFPGLRCLHIVRDPVTTYGSAKRTALLSKRQPFYFGGHDLLRTLVDMRWVPHARAIERLVADAPAQHLVVRYEDLTADAVGTISRVFEWLGAQAPVDPEAVTVLGGRAMVELPPNPSQPGVAPPQRVVTDMAGTYAYDTVVSKRERAFIELRTRPYLARLGYAAGTPRSRLALWLAWLAPDRAERQHVRSRLRWLFEIARRRVYVTRALLERAA